MKLYDSDEKFCHCDIKTSLSGDMSIAFTLCLKDCISHDYKLIEKNCEILVTLGKKKKLYFYLADKKKNMKLQIKTEVLELNKQYHVVIVRSMCTKRNIIYINGKIHNVNCIEEEFYEISDLSSDFCYWFGGDCNPYTMHKLKIYSEDLSIKDVDALNVYDTCDSKGVFEHIFCRLYENYSFECNGIYYIMTKDKLILFPDVSKDGNKNPEYAFTLYNIENNKKNVPVDGLKIIKYDDLCCLFDMDEFVTNIITWQFDGVDSFQSNHPKKISTSTVAGYWAPNTTDNGLNGFNPFKPYLGNETGSPADFGGDLKNGFVISFVKLIMDRYVCTENLIYRESFSNLVDYLNKLPGSSAGIGPVPDPNKVNIPDVYPPDALNAVANTNAAKTSLHKSNYLNYLKIVRCILDYSGIRNLIDDNRITTLNSNHDDVLALLLNLQHSYAGKPTIWSNFYIPAAVDGTEPNIDIDSENTPSDTTATPSRPKLLSTLESAEILLYLMSLNCKVPAQKDSIKNSIKYGVEWFQKHKLDLDKYVQSFVDGKLKIEQYNYTKINHKKYLFSHYYTVGDVNVNGTQVQPQNPIYFDLTSGVYYSTTSSFPDNYNNFASLVDQEYQFGTWGCCVLNMYDEWVKINDSPCNPTSGKCKIGCNGHNCGSSSNAFGCKKSCGKF
jgi:hypothetical protein